MSIIQLVFIGIEKKLEEVVFLYWRFSKRQDEIGGTNLFNMQRGGTK